jgi:hypothetical protein
MRRNVAHVSFSGIVQRRVFAEHVYGVTPPSVRRRVGGGPSTVYVRPSLVADSLAM